MIFDTLSHCDIYKALSPNFRTAFEFLQNTDFSSLPVGKLDVDGEKVFATVQKPELAGWNERSWEAHRKYADIQLILDGEEIMGFAPVETLKITSEYNPDADYALYAGDGNKAVLKQGQFMIFFPQDAHKPCVKSGEHKSRKVVVKVMVG